MILEEGTDEQLKRSAIMALLPEAGSVWTWGSGVNALHVVRVDDEMVHAALAEFAFAFTYTAEYWVLVMSATPGWRRM